MGGTQEGGMREGCVCTARTACEVVGGARTEGGAQVGGTRSHAQRSRDGVSGTAGQGWPSGVAGLGRWDRGRRAGGG
eukprot:4358805-Prymnesium_polylepis.1